MRRYRRRWNPALAARVIDRHDAEPIAAAAENIVNARPPVLVASEAAGSATIATTPMMR